MKKHEWKGALEATIPDPSPIFGLAIRETLSHLELEKEEFIPMKQPIVYKRRTLITVLAAVLMIAAVATAATLLYQNVFDVTMGDTPANAAALTQFDLATETIGDAKITVKEAAYDGMSLYILYSIQDLTATEPFGAANAQASDEAFRRIEGLGVGWWADNLWIDGEKVSMPNMSGGDTLLGEGNGEILYYMQYRLDQANLYLDGKNVEIALPIGERQDPASLVSAQGEEAATKPEKGIIEFELDCSSREQVTTEEPNVLMEGNSWSAKVSKVVYSPIQMYVTLEWDIKQSVLDAYIAEHGDGYYENGIKYWDYDGLEVCGSEIMNLQLVDANGNPVFETVQGYYGCGGASTAQAWYTFPYVQEYPDHMYLAPEIDGALDMTQAIFVK